MGTVHHLYDTQIEVSEAPDKLHLLLAPAQTHVITFRGEAAMQSYRRMLYSVNKQGQYRYRTMRDENSMWGLVVWRMR